MPKAEKVKIVNLILDFDLYPRHQILAFNVQSIMRTLEAGFSIPPIVADRKTKKVIDGFNRATAMERLYGEEAEIEVEWRDYKSKAAMFEDAMLLNTAHGEKLNSYDMARCVIIADQLHIQKDRVAECLRATPDWVETLRNRKIAEGPDGPMAMKGTVSEWARSQNAAVEAGRDPRPLTQRQVRANDAASGMPWWFLLDKAIAVFESNILPLDNEKAFARVKRLTELAKAWLEKVSDRAA